MFGQETMGGVGRNVSGRLLRVDSLAPWGLILGAWLAMHPYMGVNHDAVLYSVSALKELNAGDYAGDFFFAAGTQFDFTVFPLVFATAVDFLGLSLANQVLLIAAHGLFLCAAALFLRQVFQGGGIWLGLLLVVALPNEYGGLGILSYAEPFLTPRPFGEAFGLFALWGLLAGRYALCVAALGLSLAMHPLMALPAIGVICVYLILIDRRWLYAAVALVAGFAGLGFAGLSPFDALYLRFDSAWLDTVVQRSRFLFMHQWSVADWAGLLLDLALLTLAAVITTGQVRRLFIAILVAGVVGIVASAIGTDLLGNLLLTQVQPWRIGWLLSIAGNAALALALFHFYCRVERTPPATFVASLLIVLMAIQMTEHFVPFNAVFAAVVGIPAMVAAVAVSRGRTVWFPKLTRHLALGLAIGLLVLAVFVAASVVYKLQRSFGVHSSPMFDLAHTAVLLITATVCLGAAWLSLQVPALLRSPAMWGLVLILVVVGGASWDRRDAWDRMIDQPSPAMAELSSLVPPTASVYWEEGIRLLWLAMRRSSYVSNPQSAGAVFDQTLAREFALRRSVIAPLRTREAMPAFQLAAIDNLRHQRPGLPDVKTVCTHPAGPDVIVLLLPVPELAATVWSSPVPLTVIWRLDSVPVPEAVRNFYIYDCAKISAS